MNGAIDIAGYFIEEGGVVAVRSGSSKIQVMEDPDDSTVFEGPMVILTSRVSASASEIVAGAMKDYGRAVLVGDDHTFGKGTVQSMHPLPTGLGALKVTTAVFFRPGGDSTQHEGVSADVLIPSVIGVREIGEMHHDYSMPSQEIAAFGGTASQNKVAAQEGPGWLTFDTKHIDELRNRSSARVTASEDFEEVRVEADKILAEEGVVHLADLLETKKEENEKEEKSGEPSEEHTEATPKGDSADAEPSASGSADSVKVESEEPKELADVTSAEEEEDDDKPSLQQQEALRILADHIALLGKS